MTLTGTETEGERGKNEKENEIGIAIRIEKIEIEGRIETVTGVAGKGKRKGTGWIERGISEDAIRRKVLRALENYRPSSSIVGKADLLVHNQCKVLMI